MRKNWLAYGLAACTGLALSMTALAQPANDNCVDRIIINPTSTSSTPGTTVAATTDGDSTCDATAGGGGDVYYSFTPTSAGPWRFALCGNALFDSALSLHFDGCPVNATVGVDPGNQIASTAAFGCDDDGCSVFAGPSRINSITLTPGTIYTIRVAAWGPGAEDAFTLEISNLGAPGNCCTTAGGCTLTATGAAGCGPTDVYTADGTCTPNTCPQPSNNNDCANAGTSPIPSGNVAMVMGDTSVATPEAAFNSPSSCDGTNGRDVWHSWTPNGNGPWEFTLCGASTFDSVISVHTACPTSNTVTNQIAGACADGGCFADPGDDDLVVAKIASVTVVGGAPHVVRISSWSSFYAGGTYTLTVTNLGASAGVCCSPTGICTAAADSSGCTGCSTWISGGTCSPDPCSAFTLGGQTCACAKPLTAGTAQDFNLAASNTQSNIPCSSGLFGLWYSFTAPAAGPYSIVATATGGTGNPSIGVFDACGGASLGCNNPCGGTAAEVTLTLAETQTIYFRVGGCADILWTGTVTVGTPTATGTCCNDTTGACTVAFNGAACPAGTTLTGSGTTCDPTPCVIINVCCNDTTAACTPIYGGICGAGTTPNASTTCSPSPCGTVGACCLVSGSCDLTSETGCATLGGIWRGDTTCPPAVACPPVGSCCVGNACTSGFQASCSGTWTGGGTCAPFNSCYNDDNCTTTTLVATLGANPVNNTDATTSFALGASQTPAQNGNACLPFGGSPGAKDLFLKFTAPATAAYTLDTCTAPGFDTTLSVFASCTGIETQIPLACNDDSATTCGVTFGSRIASVSLVAGTEYIIRFASYALTPPSGPHTLNIAYVNPAEIGSCCVATVCTLADVAGCAGGTHTIGGTCTPDPCGPPANENCCRGTTCISVAAGTCTGTVAGSASLVVTNCGPSNTFAGCCFGDYDHNGVKDITDIFTYLNAWFGGSIYADITDNGAGTPDITDIFTYLNAWFGTCS